MRRYEVWYRFQEKTVPLKAKRDETKLKVETVLNNQDPRVDNIREKLLDFQESIDYGKKPGHKDTDEFTRMRSALNAAVEEKDNAMLGTRLRALSEAADYYMHKKNEEFRFDVFSSDMRYTRLAFDRSLMRFAEESGETLSVGLNNNYLTEFVEKANRKDSVTPDERIAKDQTVTGDKFIGRLTDGFNEVTAEFKKPTYLTKIAEAMNKVKARKADMVSKYGAGECGRFAGFSCFSALHIL